MDAQLIVSLLQENLMPFQEYPQLMRSTQESMGRRSSRMEYRVEELEESAQGGLLSPNRVVPDNMWRNLGLGAAQMELRAR